MKVLLILIALLSQNLYCQTYTSVLKGNVTELSSQKKPIANAQIKSSFARSTATDSKGHFSLEFYKIPPGGKVYLNVSYKNWIVVNENDLNVNLPSNPDEQFVKIYMCTKDRLDDIRISFYNISIENITRKYNQRIALLDRSNKNYQDSLQSITLEYDKLLSIAYDLADRFSRINFDEISDIQNRAFSEFKNGRLDFAIKILENSNSDNIVADAIKQNQKGQYLKDVGDSMMREAHYVLENQIQTQFILSSWYQINFQWDSAQAKLKKAVEIEPNDFFTNYQLAKFLEEQGNYAKALHYSNEAMNYASNPSQSVAALMLNGFIHYDRNFYDSACKNYLKALDTLNTLKDIFPEVYYNDFCSLTNNLGLAYNDAKKFELANHYYLLTLNTIRNPSLQRYLTQKFDSIRTLGNLGNLYGLLNKLDSAKFFLNEVVSVYENLDSISYRVHLSDLGEAYNNLGLIYDAEKNDSLSKINYNKAINIYEELIKTNPDKYSFRLAQFYYNYAKPLAREGDTNKALKLYSNSLKICQQFEKIDPDLVDPFLALIYIDLDYLYSPFDLMLAIDFDMKSLKIREELVRKFPGVYDLDLATLLNNIGENYLQADSFYISENYFRRSLRIADTLTKINFSAYAPALADAYLKIGKVYLYSYEKNQSFDSAKTYFDSAYNIALKFNEIDSTSNALNLSHIYYYMGEYFIMTNNFKSSEEPLKKCISIRLKLANYNRNLRRTASNAVLDLSSAYYNQNKFDSSIIALNQIIDLYSNSNISAYDNVILFKTYFFAGLDFIRLNQPDNAKIYFQNAISYYNAMPFESQEKNSSEINYIENIIRH